MPVPATRAVLDIAIAALALTSASTITPLAILITPVSLMVASPERAASLHLDVPVSYNNKAASPGDVIVVSPKDEQYYQ